MAIQECENGHIYDNALYESCPYCVKMDKIVFFGSDDIGKTVPLAANYDIGVTVAAGGAANSDIGVTVAANGAVNFDIGATVAAGGFVSSDTGATVAAGGLVNSDTGATMAAIPSGNSQIGVTVAPTSYDGYVENNNTGSTVGVYRRKNGVEPIVGWLVCIDGPQKGKDYRIYDKVNGIGRDERMDICLRGDAEISRENHAKLGYDKKYNSFHIIPVDSMWDKQIYLNEEPVYAPMKLKARDIIEIGSFKLCFIPFCNEDFAWDSDKKDGND